MFDRFSGAVRPFVSLGLGGLLLTAGACKKDHDHQPTAHEVTLELEHLTPAGTAFGLNQPYTNAAGEAYQLTMVRYYVSNIRLTRADGTPVWAEPASYHLIDLEAGNAPEITLADVPNADYTTLTFSLGVDSAANASTDKPGDLSPNLGMLWTWDTGYKFMKIEGTHSTGAVPAPGLVIHPGTNRAYRTLTLPLPTAATVRADIAPEIHLTVTPDRLFGSTPATTIRFGAANYDQQGGGGEVPKLMNNATTMFAVEHVHNEASH